MVLNHSEEQVCRIPRLNLLTAIAAPREEQKEREREIKETCEHLDKWNKV